MKSLLLRFWKEESGATAIEYGLIAAGIAIAIITAVKGVGTQLSTNFATISTPRCSNLSVKAFTQTGRSVARFFFAGSQVEPAGQVNL